MPVSSPEYLAELFRQMAFIAAVLGGFSAAFLATVVTAANSSRYATIAIGAAAFASASFVAVTVGATVVALNVVALGLSDLAAFPAATDRARFWTGLLFLVGIYALILALGMSGWLRSRATGWTTTAAAVLAAIGATVALAAAAG
ncbi:MAG: hypothetical protein R3247_07945 [Rhodothermales bacterium]|nr:hypothetical protein [Rhodothermales bacterium]